MDKPTVTNRGCDYALCSISLSMSSPFLSSFSFSFLSQTSFPLCILAVSVSVATPNALFLFVSSNVRSLPLLFLFSSPYMQQRIQWLYVISLTHSFLVVRIAFSVTNIYTAQRMKTGREVVTAWERSFQARA